VPPAAAGSHSYAGLPVTEFLDALAAGRAAPAGGSAAALVVAQAAALCAKTARLSARTLTDDRSAQLAFDAEQIRAEAASLIDEDARAYAAVIEVSRRAAAARRALRESVGDAAATPEPDAAASAPAGDPAAKAELDARIVELSAALSDAADVPMRIVQRAADVAQLAVTLSAFGNPALRGDAVAAALLAQAAARSATLMISINLADSPGDARPPYASDLLMVIAQSVDLVAG
jgi:methenyltetrahydrofolate cyclohydrolase